jgi:uncharacterized protein (DUF927 family)
MRADGLYVDEETYEEGRKVMIPVRISDPFEAAARVSDPRTGAAYGLWVTFRDEQQRDKQTVIPAASLHGPTRDICARLADLGLHIQREYGERVMEYLQDQMRRAPSADLASTPGWLTPAVYALPDATYGEQENGRAAYYGGDTREHNYRTRGTLAEWQERVARPCVGNSRLILAVAAGFAGPLLADAGENSGGVHLWGKSSTGKTTLLVVGGSVCGGGDTRSGFTSSWRTTSNGLEPLLAGHNDGTLFIDEIGQADARAISELIYTAGNSSGKHRMTRELAAAPTLRWRALIGSSGEHTLEAYAKRAGVKLAGGAAVRLIDIPADAGKGSGVFETLHESKSPGAFADRLKAAALECYGVALREFLSCFTRLSTEDRRMLISEHREEFLTACNLAGACPEVSRAANRMAVIAAAGELAISLDILPWEAGAAIEGVRTCFNAWRESRGGDTVAHDDARAIEQVRLFIERYGDSRFESAALNLRGSERVTDRAGWRRLSGEHTVYLIQPEFFRAEVCKGYDAATVARALHARNHLRRQGRHWTVRTTIPGAGKREMYCILDSLLSEAPA